MLLRGFDRASLTLAILALAVAGAILLVGGYRGHILGFPLSARSADRPLLLFSVLFLLRAWWPRRSPAPERRLLHTLYEVWRGKSRRLSEDSSSPRPSATSSLLAGVLVWACLGAAVGVAEASGLAAGHRYLFPDRLSVFLVLGASAALYAVAGAAVAVPALVLTAAVRLSSRFALGAPSRVSEVMTLPRARQVSALSIALFPLVATLSLGRVPPVWSLPPGADAMVAGATQLAAFVAGTVALFAGLPAGLRAAVRRPWLGLGITAGVVLACWGGVAVSTRSPVAGSRPSRAGARAPNLLLITIDTLRADRLGCYGNARVKTPRMDALAAEGVRFAQAVCQIPETGPSHASILTGRYPQSHGARANGQAPSEMETLATLLAQRGYRCAAFVSGYTLKSRLAGLARGFGVYDECFSRIESLPGLTLIARLERSNVLTYVDLWKIWAERPADATNASVFRWLRASSGEDSPFFLWVHYFDPHGPYDPPPPYARMYYEGDERDPSNRSMKNILIAHRYQEKPGVTDVSFYVAQYDAEVTWTDSQVAALLDEIAALGLSGKTLVVLTADHGESLTEHDYYFAHGGDLFEPSVHVPLMVAGPEVAKGRIVTGQVQSVDIAPTLLDFLGSSSPGPETPDGGGGAVASMDGRSLAALLRGAEENPPPPIDPTSPPAIGSDRQASPPAAFIEGEVTERRRGMNYDDPVAAKERAIRWSGFKLVMTPSFGEALYHLSEDPGESTDLSSFYPAVASTMRRRLADWIASDAQAGRREALPEEERRMLESLGYVGR